MSNPGDHGRNPRNEVSRDRVEYIADLILELKDMARDQRLTTLAGILDLAHAEARLRSRDAA